MLVGLWRDQCRLHDAIAIHNKGGAAVDGALLVEDAVGATGSIARPVTEQREFEGELLGEDVRRRRCIDAYAQNLGTGGEEIILDLREAAELGCSAAGKRHRVERHDDRLLAAIVRQIDASALAIGQ
jgi:hypothetical protein